MGSGNEGDGRPHGGVHEAAGNAGPGTRRAAEGLPVARRHRQARVPPLPLSAAATRRRHAQPGDRGPVPADERRGREVRDGVGLVHSRAAQDPARHGEGVDRADAGARAVSLPDPRCLPAPGARPRRQGRAAALARDPAQRRAAHDLPGAEHLRHQVPDAAPGRRQRRRPDAGQLRRAAREGPQPGRARQGRGSARRHLRRDGKHVCRGLQRHAAARLVPRPGAQLPDHARRRARRQRDSALGRRDADRRDPQRRRAVPSLRAPAQEAPRAAELPPLRRLPADLPQRQDLPVRAGARARAGVGRPVRRRLRREVQALRLGRPDRRLRERRQAQRCLQRRRLRRRPLPADELQRHARRRVHARPRGGARDAHGAVVREPAVRHRRATRSSSPRSRRRPTSA